MFFMELQSRLQKSSQNTTGKQSFLPSPFFHQNQKAGMDKRVFEAAKSGDSNIIDALKEDEILEKVTPQMSNVLHIAVRYNQMEIAEEVISKCPLLIIKANTNGDTPLHEAARIGSSEMVKILINGAKRVGLGDIEGGQRIGVKRMLSMKNLVKEDTALHVGVRNGHLEVVKLLIDADRELLGVVNGAKESPLFLAVEESFFEIAKHIIENSPDSLPPCGGSNAMNALHAAVVRTHHQAPFSDHDHMPSFSRENLRRLIKISIFHMGECIGKLQKPKTGMLDVIELLIEKRANLIQEKDMYGWTPLHCAAHLGHLKATQLLLQHSSHVSYLKDKEGMSALHIAAKEGYVRVMQEIIHQTPEACDLVDSRGWTALHSAVVSEKLNVVRYVLKTSKLEVLLNIADKDGNTPLHLASGRKNYKITKILVDNRRVDKRVTNLKGLKPIDIFLTNSHIGRLGKSWLSMRLKQQGGYGSLQHILHSAKQEGDEEHEEKTANEEKQVNEERVSFSQLTAKMTPMNKKNKTSKSHRLEKISSTHLLVATLIATVTFTAAFTIPGGYENDGKRKGMSVLSNKAFFNAFVVADSIAFYCSTASVLLQFFSSTENSYHLVLRFTVLSAALTYISIFGMAVAFASGLRVVMPSSSSLADFTLVMGGCSVFLFIIAWL